MADKIVKIEYLGLECMMFRRNGVNYYNVSNWCKQVGEESKTYSHWVQTDDAKDKIRVCLEESGLDTVIIKKSTGPNDLRGMYVYDKLAMFVAMWIDNEIGIRVVKLFTDEINRKYMRALRKKDANLKEKDDKIDELNRKIDEMMRDTKQVLRDNQVTHSKLEEAHVKLDVVQEELVETKAEREEISAKLDVVTDMLGDLAVNTVPTDGWNKFAVYKVSSSKYKAVRCRNSAYEKQVIRSIPSGSRCIYETDVPNGIEYFATFKEEYARNKDKCRNIVSVSYNDISLKSVNEEEFINILHQHRKRIDEMLEEAQASQDTVIPK